MSTEPLVVFITPEVRAALEAEVERAGVGGGLTGGLLFGHPLDERRRLVVGWARMRPEVRFGEKDFNLDQSRTSQQLDQARDVSPTAHYCGVWYIHLTPNKELTDEEWVQTQSVLEDPDYRFDDLVCLVLCLYFGDLTLYTSTFDKLFDHIRIGKCGDVTQIACVFLCDFTQYSPHDFAGAGLRKCRCELNRFGSCDRTNLLSHVQDKLLLKLVAFLDAADKGHKGV